MKAQVPLHLYAKDFTTGDWIAGTDTASDGTYSITVPTGTYRVCSCADCDELAYVDECYNNVYDHDDAEPVSVTEPNNTPNIHFALVVGGTLSGKATIEGTSTPINNLHVRAEDFTTGDWIAGSNTAADGTYSIRVPTGTYRVCSCADCEGLQYVDECYNNKHDGDDAEPVSVTEPNNTPNIHFALVVGGTISGKATIEGTSTPINNLHLYALDFTTGDWIAGSNTAADGTYSIRVPTGTYKVCSCADCEGLQYVDECYNNKYDGDTADPVSVTEPNDTPNIHFALAVTPRYYLLWTK